METEFKNKVAIVTGGSLALVEQRLWLLPRKEPKSL
jgi:hypothetical protein